MTPPTKITRSFFFFIFSDLLEWSDNLGLIACTLYSRAGQNFGGLISQTPNKRLTQNVKVYQVSGPTRDVWSRPQSPKDKHLTYEKGLSRLFSGLCGRDPTSLVGPETWYTFTFWANLEIRVWEMRPQKFWPALVCTYVHNFFLLSRHNDFEYVRMRLKLFLMIQHVNLP